MFNVEFRHFKSLVALFQQISYKNSPSIFCYYKFSNTSLSNPPTKIVKNDYLCGIVNMDVYHNNTDVFLSIITIFFFIILAKMKGFRPMCRATISIFICVLNIYIYIYQVIFQLFHACNSCTHEAALFQKKDLHALFCPFSEKSDACP